MILTIAARRTAQTIAALVAIAMLPAGARGQASWQACASGGGRCLTSGNAGIGTTVPGTVLNLVGASGTGTPQFGNPVSPAGPLFVSNTANNYDTAGPVPVATFHRQEKPNVTYANTASWLMGRGQFATGNQGFTELTLSLNPNNSTDAPSVNVMSWLYNGSVGVGTMSPGSTLEVNGNLALTAGSGGSLTFQDGTIQTSAYTLTAPNGNVGIGTANPETALTILGVSGTGLPQSGNEISPAGPLFVSNTANNYDTPGLLPIATFHRQEKPDVTYANTASWLIGRNSTATGNQGFTQLTLALNPNESTDGPSNNVMSWLYNGNVGIGTTNPQYPLSVYGTIQATEILVNTGWSDYVFDKEYRVAPLSEVDSYIRPNGHLPGIPTAAEVSAKGVNVGEIEAKLLAKIEELTLHMIEQEKTIQELKVQNTGLTERMGDLERGRSGRP